MKINYDEINNQKNEIIIMFEPTKEEILRMIDQVEYILKNHSKFDEICNFIFNRADEDDSGEISYEEFYKDYLKAVEEFNLPQPTEEEAHKKFIELDTDKSGRLSRDEYRFFISETLEKGLSHYKSLLNK